MRRASVVATRTGLLRRAWTTLQVWVLRWKIREHLAYVRECTDDGILDSLSLRDFDRQLSDMRAELAYLESYL